MNKWKEIEVGNAMQFNPSEQMKKGQKGKKIPMEKLSPYERKIQGFEIADYNGGPKFKNGDTLLAKITPCLENGKTAQVDILDNDEIGFGSTEFIVLRNNENTTTDFVYYLAKSPVFRKKAITCMEGTSGRKRVNEGALKLQVIKIPDIPTQKSIGSILKSLDSKIELNNRINAELEAMAKTIYDYWFVQFDFPFSPSGEMSVKGGQRGYKTSGGKMVWNESLKREIPEGWEVKPLSAYLNCNTNTISKNDELTVINYLDTSNLTENRINSIQKINVLSDVVPSRAQRVVKNNDILISTVRPNLRHFGIIKKPVENMIASTGFAVLSHKTNMGYNDFFYMYIISDAVQKKLESIAASAVSSYPSINPSDILSVLIALPDDESIVKRMSDILSKIFLTVSANQEQNQLLTELRDWLLPMLMNGQVKVKDAEEMLSIAAEGKVKYKKK